MQRKLPSGGPSASAKGWQSERPIILIGKVALDRRVGELLALDDLPSVRKGVEHLANDLRKGAIPRGHGDMKATSTTESTGMRADVVLGELKQVRESQTLARAKHYLRRLRDGLKEPIYGDVNEINLRRWKEYDDVWTDSLWLMGRRDSSGAHMGSYWGNFVPQIPRQLMLRYTKKGDLVLDGFVGSGTTLIECRRLGRNGIGIELNHDVATAARKLVESEPILPGGRTEIVEGDSSKVDIRPILKRFGATSVGLLIMHPPYHDIIRFSEDPDDLSNAPDVESFVGRFAACLDNLGPLLEGGRYMALVIGDKYAGGEWIPLGFRLMEKVLSRGDFALKSIIVKNFDVTRGKRKQEELWRYRALAGGFYVFKHEYIFIFRKRAHHKQH
jgi:hypothetical protein